MEIVVHSVKGKKRMNYIFVWTYIDVVKQVVHIDEHLNSFCKGESCSIQIIWILSGNGHDENDIVIADQD